MKPAATARVVLAVLGIFGAASATAGAEELGGTGYARMAGQIPAPQ